MAFLGRAGGHVQHASRGPHFRPGARSRWGSESDWSLTLLYSHGDAYLGRGDDLCHDDDLVGGRQACRSGTNVQGASALPLRPADVPARRCVEFHFSERSSCADRRPTRNLCKAALG
jgi:hypothetical protein